MMEFNFSSSQAQAFAHGGAMQFQPQLRMQAVVVQPPGLAQKGHLHGRHGQRGLGPADVGGFGVGSRFTTQGFASVGYRWTESISTALGYRAIYTDYRKDGFSYRATQHGVFSSIAYHF